MLFLLVRIRRGCFSKDPSGWDLLKNIRFGSVFACDGKTVADGLSSDAADQDETVLKKHSTARLLAFTNIDDHALFLPLVDVVLVVDRVQTEDTADLVGGNITPLQQSCNFHIV